MDIRMYEECSLLARVLKVLVFQPPPKSPNKNQPLVAKWTQQA